MLLQISNEDLINFVYLNIYVSEVENIFERWHCRARSLVCRSAFCLSRLISSYFRRSTITPRKTAKRHWEERENKDCRKAPCVVAFSTEGVARRLGVLGECGSGTESKTNAASQGERKRGTICCNAQVVILRSSRPNKEIWHKLR